MNNLFTLFSVLALGISFYFSARFSLRRGETRTGNARLFALLALAALAAQFGFASFRQHRLAIGTFREYLDFFALVVLAASLGATLLTRSQILLLLLTPVVAGFGTASLILQHWFPAPEAKLSLGNAFLGVHVLLFALSYALFFLAAAFSTMFLALDHILKSKRYPSFYFKLPGLTKLDAYSGRATLAGLLLLTVAMATALATLYGARLSHPVSAARDFTIGTAIVIWFYYAGHVFARVRLHWLSKRLSYLSLCGALLILLSYFAAKTSPASALHGFGNRQPAGARLAR